MDRMFGAIFSNYIKQLFDKCGVKILNQIHISNIATDEVKLSHIDFTYGEDQALKRLSPDIVIIDHNDESQVLKLKQLLKSSNEVGKYDMHDSIGVNKNFSIFPANQFSSAYGAGCQVNRPSSIPRQRQFRSRDSYDNIN